MIYDRIIGSYTISILSRDPAFVFVFFLSLICSWLSNKLPPAIINSPVSLLLYVSAIFKKQPRFLHKL